ncbi:hypothetical protein DFH09DRAFT_1315691 [Mycena vulgaris]|nr:hypothetical protein DFH09DRAFT_1315691 [Mycena vulgaris]
MSALLRSSHTSPRRAAPRLRSLRALLLCRLPPPPCLSHPYPHSDPCTPSAPSSSFFLPSYHSPSALLLHLLPPSYVMALDAPRAANEAVYWWSPWHAAVGFDFYTRCSIDGGVDTARGILYSGIEAMYTPPMHMRTPARDPGFAVGLPDGRMFLASKPPGPGSYSIRRYSVRK